MALKPELKPEDEFPNTLYVHANPFSKGKGRTFDAYTNTTGEDGDVMAIYTLDKVVRIRKEMVVRLEDVPNKIE